MHANTWKNFERRVARELGGQRRGAYVSNNEGSLNDIINERYSIQCKISSQPSYTTIRKAIDESRMQAKPEQAPLAVVGKLGDNIDDAIVAMKMVDFLKFFHTYEE